MPVQEIHARLFTKAVFLTSHQLPQAILPVDVIRVLNRAKVSFVLVGAYGLAGWIKDPRATEDVDVVVSAKQLKKATKVLLEAFPQLEAQELQVVIRLRKRNSEDVVIDIMKPLQQPYVDVFKHTHKVVAGSQKYRVPSLEMALVMKFSAITSVYRANQDKYQDAHDFILMAKNNPSLDLEKLSELGTLLYRDGGKDVLEMVRQAIAGEKLLI